MIAIFGPVWMGAFLLFSIITFISYQMIPHRLDTLEKDGQSSIIGSLVSSKVFTMFVRWCGMDHIVMAFGMLGIGIMMSNGDQVTASIIARIIVVSSGGVAFISAMSVLAIHAESKRKRVSNDAA